MTNKIKGIYLIERITDENDGTNKKYYIGMAEDIFDRWSQHCNNSKQHIDKEIKRIGLNKFRFQILETISSIDNLKKRESEWIKQYKEKFGDSILYNISETSNVNPESVDKEISDKIKKLFIDDIGRSIYAIAESFNLPWKKVVDIRKPLLKKKGLSYDRSKNKIIDVETGEEPSNWSGSIFTQTLADKVLEMKRNCDNLRDIANLVNVSKVDLELFLEMYSKGNYIFAQKLDSNMTEE